MIRRTASLIGLAFLLLAAPIRSALAQDVPPPPVQVQAPITQAQDLYVTSSTEGKVYRIDQSGKVSDFVPGGLIQPFGITVGPSGDFFTANFGNNSISKISPVGAVSNLPLTGERLKSPVGVAFAPNGDLYVSNYADGGIGKGSISKISPTGVVSTWVTGLTGPTDIVFSAIGDLYVSNYSGGVTTGVYRITPSKQVSSVISTGSLSQPYGLVFLGDDLIIASYANGRISRKTPTASPSVWVQNTTLLAGQMGIVAKEGHLYVANMNKGTITKIMPALGSPTPVLITFAVGLKAPTGMVLK